MGRIAKEIRKKAREQLLKRTEESRERSESVRPSFSIFRPDLDIPLWKCGEGRHVIDIIPYPVGKNWKLYPVNKGGQRLKEGDITYCLELYVHQRVGVDEISIICPRMTYREPCPICEDISRMGENEQDIVNALKPRRRVIYNIVCCDNEKEIEKGVQVWEVAHWNMERHFKDLVVSPRGGGIIVFSDPDVGKSITFVRRGSGPNNTQFVGHAFVDRDYVISDEILESVFILDEIVVIPTYDDIKEIYYGRDVFVDKEKEDEEVIEEEQREKEVRSKKVGPSPRRLAELEEEEFDEEEESDVGDYEVEDEEDEEDEEDGDDDIPF